MEHRDDVVGQPLAVALQRLRALLAGLAGGDPHFDELLVGEQAHRLRGTDQPAPVEVGAGDGMDLALGVAGGARGRTDQVAGLLSEQRLVPPQRIDRAQPLLQVSRQLIEAQLHQTACTAASRRITCATMSLCMVRKSSASSCSLASASSSL